MSQPTSNAVDATPAPNRAIVVAALAGLTGLAIAALSHPFRDALFLLAVALMLHIALNPVVDQLHRFGARRSVAVVTVYTAVALVLVGAVVAVGPVVAAQVRAMAAELPELYVRLQARLVGHPSAAFEALGRLLPEQWDPRALWRIAGYPETSVPSAVTPLAAAVRSAHALVNTLAVFTLAFYVTADRDRLIQGLMMKVSPARREPARDLIAEIEQKAGRYYRGQLILSAVVGVASSAFYAALGMPFALLLGVQAALLEAVPLIGTTLGGVAPVAIAVSQAPALVGPVVVFSLVLQLVEAYLLIPWILDRSVGVNSVVSIFAVLVMASLYGLLGAFIAIPAAAIIQVILRRWVFDAFAVPLDDAAPVAGAAGGTAAPHRDAHALLRYRALELQQDAARRIRDPDRTREMTSIRHEEAIEEIAAAAHDVLVALAAAGETGATSEAAARPGPSKDGA